MSREKSCLVLLCAFLVVIVSVSASRGQAAAWNWDEVKKRRLIYQTVAVGDATFMAFSYYEPGVPETALNELFGFEISKNGKTAHIELEKIHLEYGEWELVSGPQREALLDVDGDGHDDLVVQARRHHDCTLKVFSLIPQVRELGQIEHSPLLFSLTVKEPSGKPRARLVGVHILPTYERFPVDFTDGKLIVGDHPLPPRLK